MHPRVKEFNTEYPTGFSGTLADGYAVVDKYLPPRKAAMNRAMRELELYFGPITWSTMTFQLRTTVGRYGIGEKCGANQTVVGHTLDGVEVVYRYAQGSYAEGGDRKFKYNGCALTSISLLGTHLAASLMAKVKETA